MIGGIQYLMNDESYFCKRCKLPFSQQQMQANEFEDQLDNAGHLLTVAADENIVQLGCNPAHVFHAECIESFVFCPECFKPIEQDVPHSFMDERSDRHYEDGSENDDNWPGAQRRGQSDEEDNLLIFESSAQAHEQQ